VIKSNVDNLFRTTPILDGLKRSGGIVEHTGGKWIEQPVMLHEHSTITQLTNGYDPHSLVVGSVTESARFDWCDSVAPISISMSDELSNEGPTRILAIAEERLKTQMGVYRREVAKQIIAGSSTILTFMSSLNGFDAATGFLEELAFGSQTNSVGGIAKSSFTTSWQNQVATAGGAFATNGLDAMSEIAIDIQTYSPEDGLGLVLLSPSAYKLYRSTLQLQERYVMADKTVDGGRMNLQFHGAPVEIEPNLGFTASAGTIVSGYFLNPKFLKLHTHKRGFFSLSDFQDADGYTVKTAKLFLRAQLGASHLASQGALLNAEA
jgi:hypothetical protein